MQEAYSLPRSCSVSRFPDWAEGGEEVDTPSSLDWSGVPPIQF